MGSELEELRNEVEEELPSLVLWGETRDAVTCDANIIMNVKRAKGT